MMRNIKPSSIRENDVIRVSGKIGDMEITRTGEVKRITFHQFGREYATSQGIVLLDVNRDGNTGITGLKIQLLNHTPDSPLFELTNTGSME
jgi:hypothetical protein